MVVREEVVAVRVGGRTVGGELLCGYLVAPVDTSEFRASMRTTQRSPSQGNCQRELKGDGGLGRVFEYINQYLGGWHMGKAAW